MADDSNKYKDSIHLPQTDFPMQANLAKREPEMLARWEAEQTYAAVMQAGEGKPEFRFVDGPPYANGDIHIGHAVNKVLKDMVVKAARLDGYQAPFVPGWDCHGLPIELQVEKKFGKVGEKLSAAEFRAKCREYAAEQVERQRVDFKRLGILGDWERPYLTMQPGFEAEQLRVLSRICARGHVVRGFKPVHWCLDCGSSLAEAEVEYQDKQSSAIDVAFVAVDGADLGARFGGVDAGGAGFVIWTTTPWTLPANQAISVNAELDYALVQLGARKLVLAAGLVEGVCKRLGGEGQILATAKGKALEGAKAQHPFAERVVPIICGEHVTLDAGTGLVHTAPAHGVEDYGVGKLYGLPVDNPVGSNGVFIAGTPLVAGLHARKAEEPILAALEASGALLHKATITHSYPHCWRHKTPLIFRATPQWFISMDKEGLRAQALSEIAATQWIPGWGEDRIAGMIRDRPDWCISRQRYWGVPLAVFVHRETQTLHPDTPALLLRVADAVQERGLEAWFGSSPADWGVDEAAYEKGSDTLDVWFDSGVVFPASFVANGQSTPDKADIYLEGSDQHRGWFHSSLLTRVATDDKAPYKSVLTHGFTVDEQGRKMSKSLGNVVAPQKVISTLGADVLRLWVSSADYSGEIAISDNLLKRTADAYRRIRNTARYLLGSLHGFDPATDAVAPAEMVAVDRWAISEAARVQAELKSAYGDREFHRVYHALHNYCVNDLGGLYLDLLKDRLYTLPEKSLARRSAQTALWHIAEGLVRWIAPILSFTADEIWRLLPGDRSQSVFAQGWWSFPAVSVAELDWSGLLAARDAVRKELEGLRIAGTIGASLQAEVVVQTEGTSLEALRQVEPELRFWLQTSAVRVEPGSGGALKVLARPSTHGKCDRCWHYREDVGQHPGHETICGRCVSNIEGPGETRRWF
ncbi:isoleucine--tRNA ligase [Stagnimonas aquatica]|uniref:Isoleucine--tRNA ligase n=2 Tax=Stagnimonas aquatica TaxID=2689987 RepID=A0A3N0V9H8_9GAMM|nr:isoleucine--tRNA ligase [Stagnimonas aquatica]ROH89447.1 isoleucine--tRNA ligase [Stagnimonas aquatica]